MPFPDGRDPNIGRVLDNRYEIIELIGKGAMGRVYLAKHTLLAGAVAVKFLAQTLLGDRMRERFRTEASTCAQLGQKSIHIVRVTDYGLDEHEVPFYVMEYLQGDSLSVVIQANPLPIPRFLRVTRQICLGLKAAHDGIEINKQTVPIIHRDIKPSNILISPDDSMGEMAKILDFGIAKLLQEGSNQTGTFMGTLAYASPEQMEGLELDCRSDIYSLGIMMFQMLTGKMPIYTDNHTFGGWYKAHRSQEPQRFEDIAPHLELPKNLSDLIYSCLGKDRSTRPANIQKILETLEPLEKRYEPGLDLGYRIRQKIDRVPVVEPTPQTTTTSSKPQKQGSDTVLKQVTAKPSGSPEELCYLQTWPQNKPIARIVFPRIVSDGNQKVPTLWVMLSRAEIEQLQLSQLYLKRFCTFTCTMSPHPMAMWQTAIHNSFATPNEVPRWFYCFLDLKTNFGQQILESLGSQQTFRMLFFPTEEPERCQYVMSWTLNTQQQQRFSQWIVEARGQHAAGNPALSKDLLRSAYQRQKPETEAKLRKQPTA